MDKQDATNELAIVGAETTDHTVPAEVLARTLDGLQRIVHLMAASALNLPIGNRFTPSDGLRTQNTLRCGIPRASSFAVPIRLDRPQRTLFDKQEPLSDVFDVFRLASSGHWDRLNQLFPKPKYRARVLSELQGMLPKEGERWALRLKVGGEIATADDSTRRSLESFVSSTASEDATLTVTGDLVKVNIESLQLVIRYSPTHSNIRCQCEPSVFHTVMRNYDVPIQVTGLYTLDRKGHPKRLTGVTRVEPVDLSPITLSQVTDAGRRLIINPELTLSPTMDEESGQFYNLDYRELGIDVFARTRDELMDELAEQLFFQWDTYAQENPDRLSRGARQLREALRARIREVERAAPSEDR